MYRGGEGQDQEGLWPPPLPPARWRPLALSQEASWPRHMDGSLPSPGWVVLGRSAPGPPQHPLLTMPDLACLMPMPGGAAWSLPATLGQPHWHSEPGEPLTALALLAEEMHPACLEMSGWWGTGTALTPPHPHHCMVLETGFGPSDGTRPTLPSREGLLGSPAPLGERQRRPAPRGDAH